MLESLMEIEIAFNLLKAGDAVKDKDPIDAHYEKLETELQVNIGFTLSLMSSCVLCLKFVFSHFLGVG